MSNKGKAYPYKLITKYQNSFLFFYTLRKHLSRVRHKETSLCLFYHLFVSLVIQALNYNCI